MSQALDKLKGLLDECSKEEQAALLDNLKARLPHPIEEEWGVGADVILTAIARSSDLTKRGIRGIIAEAIFERHILPSLEGWEAVRFNDDRPYDFLVRSKEPNPKEVRIQVKLQRMKMHRAMLASEANRNYPKDMHVVEVQKTRGGIDLQTNEDTRPYRFGEFDILAVNLHPSTKDWNKFLFTVGNWLIQRSSNPALMEIFQPVPYVPNASWTDNLGTSLEWLSTGQVKRILDIAPELLQRRIRKPKRNS